MNEVKWVALFFIIVFVSGFSGMAFDSYLEHEKFKLCLENPRCDYHRADKKEQP